MTWLICLLDVVIGFTCMKLLGPVVQSIVSLMTSLRRQLVKYMPTEFSNTLIFCEKNVRIFCIAKDSHIFPTKNNSVFGILTF